MRVDLFGEERHVRHGFAEMVSQPGTVSTEERALLAETRLGHLLLGKFRLEALIGIGGTAVVFEAIQPNRQHVAIKMLHADLAGSREVRERFLAEGYAANRVSHPGVVTVREEGATDDGSVFLVMDLLRGQTLAERVEAGGELFSMAEVLEISGQLLDVLVHAHERGIVHRDIKPENVFLTREGRVLLLDFGIASTAGETRPIAMAEGTTWGTPAFMPPEQALGRWADLDGRSDLWSLGATMFLLLAGRPVRESGSVSEQLLSAMTQPAPSLGEVARLPRSVIGVVDRALAFDRRDRFPDAGSMQLAVRAALDELRTPDHCATLPPPSVEPVALSLRTPRPDSGSKRPSLPTMRPVSSSFAAPPLRVPEQRSALPVFVAFGIALGIGIVVAARLTTLAPATPASAVDGPPAAPVTALPLSPSVAEPSARVSPPPSASR